MKDGDKGWMAGVTKLVSAGLLKRAAGPHLDAECLAAFSHAALSPAERESALNHLSLCRDCREILFLAQPDGAEQIVVTPVRTHTVRLFRWAAVTASIAIVTAGAFFARRELSNEPQITARQIPAPGYVDLDEQKAAAPQVPRHEAVAPVTTATDQLNGRPEPKHMTAKPQTRMQFDSTDQVRFSNAAAPAPQSSPTRGRDETALRDLVATTPAPAYGFSADKSKTPEAPRRTTESVEVSANSLAVSADSPMKKDAAISSLNGMTAGYAGGRLAKAIQFPAAQWVLSNKGEVQRSLDQGKSWQTVAVNGTRAGFRVVSSSGAEVWVGGNSGALYHSADSGLTWARVIPTAGVQQLSGDIVHIEFADAQNGKVTASDSSVWTTADGGQTWIVSRK